MLKLISRLKQEVSHLSCFSGGELYEDSTRLINVFLVEPIEFYAEINEFVIVEADMYIRYYVSVTVTGFLRHTEVHVR